MLLKIQNILRAADIEGFIALGVPDDEYDAEAANIAKALLAQRAETLTLSDAVSIISLIWVDAFDLDRAELDKRLPDISIVSSDILQLLSR